VNERTKAYLAQGGGGGNGGVVVARDWEMSFKNGVLFICMRRPVVETVGNSKTCALPTNVEDPPSPARIS
jgi:hypothetical protein